MMPMPVKIQRADGSVYDAEFVDWWDLRDIGRGFVPCIGRKCGESVSHGMLEPGEKLLTEVPPPEKEEA